MEFLTDWYWSLASHDWMTFATYSDKVRAFMWIAINLTTAVSYFLIPMEIWHWRKCFPFHLAGIVSVAFMGFIFFCGTHHIVDAMIMPTAPWWAIWSVNIWMAVCSVITAFYLRVNRERIKEYLSVFALVLRNLQVIKANHKDV